MLPVLLHHNALCGGDAVVFQKTVQVGQGSILCGTGTDHQLAAAGHIVGQHGHFLLRQIGGGRINQDAVRFLGNFIHSQKRQGVDLVVFLFQLVREGGRQFGFAMTFQDIQLGQVLGGNIVDGRGDGTLPVERGTVAVGVDIRLGHIDVVVADVPVPVAALHHKAVIGHILIGVLFGKGGIDVRIPLDHRNVV